jgi:disulfide bond formation protein DsbB
VIKKYLFFIAILLSINLAYALDKSAGCSPPMSFAKEHNCTLVYTRDNVVGGYNCGEWKIQGDCEGGIISSKKMFVLSTRANWILIGILAIIFVILLVCLIYLLNRKDKDLEEA